MDIQETIQTIERFQGSSLAQTIRLLTHNLVGANRSQVAHVNDAFHIHPQLLRSALTIKQLSAQIDTLVHASCISYSLPFLLNEHEYIESMSLGADNSESTFDVITNLRIAEFKFILWKVKGNAGREKVVFGDFFKLVREPTSKKKCLYILNKTIPERFLQGQRNILNNPFAN